MLFSAQTLKQANRRSHFYSNELSKAKVLPSSLLTLCISHISYLCFRTKRGHETECHSLQTSVQKNGTKPNQGQFAFIQFASRAQQSMQGEATMHMTHDKLSQNDLKPRAPAFALLVAKLAE